jgi:glycosyltransferase involved in cell wall biosynthesis
VSPLHQLRVAVVHDWLTGMRGGEKVLEAILDLFPSAEIFTLFHLSGTVSEKVESFPIHVSGLQKVVRWTSDYRRLLPLFPRAVRDWELRDFDLVLSSSHCVAKGVDPGDAVHVCYCHTPMRYVWDRFDDYFPRSRPLLRAAVSIARPYLQRWDVDTARTVDEFIANSKFVARRIENFYGRASRVIHPFAGDEYFEAPLNDDREDFDVIVSALVPYKRVDLAVRAANESGRRLVVIGKGPLAEELRTIASDRVTFLGAVDGQTLRDTLSRATSFVMPGVEDFGITVVEAMACGTPVVALRDGGAVESVVEGRCGIFFDAPDVASLADALRASAARQWDRDALRARALEFSRARFMREMRSAVEDALAHRGIHNDRT